MEKHPNSYYHWKPRRKSRKHIQLRGPNLARYNHSLIVKLNKLEILSVLEALDLQSISNRVIINLSIFYVR